MSLLLTSQRARLGNGSLIRGRNARSLVKSSHLLRSLLVFCVVACCPKNMSGDHPNNSRAGRMAGRTPVLFVDATCNSGKLYTWYQHSSALDQATANQKCTSMGGRLAEFRCSQENTKAMADLEFAPNWGYCHTAGLDTGGRSWRWQWASGASISYTNWDGSEPGNSELIIVVKSRGHGLRWHDHNGSPTDYYLCEGAPAIPCTNAGHCNNRATSGGVSGNTNTGAKCACNCRGGWSGATCGSCPSKFGGADCDTCASGREQYPNCYITCTNALHCNNRGSGVTGTTTPSGCNCNCRNQWEGNACQTCNSKFNSGDDCQSCASGFESYPNCYRTCSKATDCNGNHANSVTGNVNTPCQCSCKTEYDGASCNTCAAGYTGGAYPSCFRVCTEADDCSNHATSVSGTSSTGCTCTCRTMWTPGNCGTCPVNYGGTDCNACATGYDSYSSCYRTCTSGLDCNGHADSVSGNLNSGCICTCQTNFDGQWCDLCATGFARYPECGTITDTLSESVSQSTSISSSSTGATPSASLSNSESQSVSLSHSGGSQSPTESASGSNSRGSRSSTKNTATHSPSASVTMTISRSDSMSTTDSATVTPAPTPSVSPSASRSLTLSPSFSASDSNTKTTSSSLTLTESVPSISISHRTATVSLHHAWLNVSNASAEVQVSEMLVEEEADGSNAHLLVLEVTVGGGESFDAHGIRNLAATKNKAGTSTERSFAQQQESSTSPSVGLDMSYCLSIAVDGQEMKDYVLGGNVTATIHNATTMRVQFGRLPANLSWGIADMAVDREAELSVEPPCLSQRKPTSSVNFTFIKPPPKKAPHVLGPVLATTAKVVAGARAVPGVAVFSARSSIILTLIECEPDWYEELDRMQNIFGVGFGDPKYAQYVGTAIMNQVFMLGVVGLHILSAFIYSKKYECTFRHATSRVRCPSLTLIPILIALEPTCMAAVVTILYGSPPVKFVGVVSITLCYAYVIGGFIYLRKTWAGKFIPGQSPAQEARAIKNHHRSSRRTTPPPSPLLPTIDDGANDNHNDDHNDDQDQRPTHHEGAKHRTSATEKFYAWCGYFLDGGVSWKDADPENNKGYCRRNRLLFMDFNAVFYWFLSVELIICALCGTLDGIKMGVHQCNGIVITLLVILMVYFVAIVKYRPYNAPFLLIFSIALTVIQLGAVLCMMVAMFGGGEDWQTYAENITLFALYVIIGRAIFDIAPKLKQSVVALVRGCFPPRGEQNSQNQDLTQQLLEAVREDDHVEQHMVLDEVPDEAELELPEFDYVSEEQEEEEEEPESVEEEPEIPDEDIFGIAPRDMTDEYAHLDQRGAGGNSKNNHSAFDEEMERLLAGVEAHEGQLKLDAKAKRQAEIEAARELRAHTAENAAAIKRSLISTLGIASAAAPAGGRTHQTTALSRKNTPGDAVVEEEDSQHSKALLAVPQRVASEEFEDNKVGDRNIVLGEAEVQQLGSGDTELDALLDQQPTSVALSPLGSRGSSSRDLRQACCDERVENSGSTTTQLTEANIARHEEAHADHHSEGAGDYSAVNYEAVLDVEELDAILAGGDVAKEEEQQHLEEEYSADEVARLAAL